MKSKADKLIWQPNAYNVRGQLTNYLRGTNLVTQQYYDGYGFQTGDLMSATGVGTYAYNAYDFDEIKGNLLSRNNHLTQRTENFTYDNLNRLTNENVVNGTQLTTSFSPNGNISQKTDIGTYAYGDAGPHAVTGLSNTTGSLLPANNQTIDYTSFNKASHIGQGNLDYFITYGPDRLRRKTQLNSGIGDDVLLTKYYAFGDYEKEVTPTGTRHLHYISGGDGLAAIYVKYNNAPDSLYFIINDHLGSIVGAINSATGTVYKQNFDAWGRKRNPITLSYTNIPDFPFDRGYTGHEHLKRFGLINMNGRMYDPALCRFLSPDPFVQHPGFSQSYNRYTYCLNNPLKYTDPSGYNNHPVWIDNIICWEAYGLVGRFGGGSGGGSSSIMPGSGNHWSDQYRRENANNYFAWANLHYNNVTKTTYGDYAQSGGQFLLNGSDVITYTGMSSDFYAAYLNSENNYLRNNLLGLSWDAGRGNTFGGISFGDPPGGALSGSGDNYSLFFNGYNLSVWSGNHILYYTPATSGKGDNMNNPNSQELSNLGTIPEGTYYFYNSQWESQSILRQVYNLIAGNGDWGDYNVPLSPINYQGYRNSFYLHGGFFEGSAGCIDAGAFISNIYNYVNNQNVTYLRVKY